MTFAISRQVSEFASVLAKKHHFITFFFQLFKKLESTLSFYFDSLNHFQQRKGAIKGKDRRHSLGSWHLLLSHKKIKQKQRQSGQTPRGTFTTSLSHNVAKRGHGASFLTRAPRVKHMHRWFSQPLSKDKWCHTRKKKKTITLQLAPLEMISLYEKQKCAGQTKYWTQYHKQAWNAHL